MSVNLHEPRGYRACRCAAAAPRGAYFLAADLPADPHERDDLLLRIMGSPDGRQVDGIGGGHPLSSKVAIVSPASDERLCDVDYLFLQVVPDRSRWGRGSGSARVR